MLSSVPTWDTGSANPLHVGLATDKIKTGEHPSLHCLLVRNGLLTILFSLRTSGQASDTPSLPQTRMFTHHCDYPAGFYSELLLKLLNR